MQDLTVRYPGQVDVADPNYPWGKARNQIDEGDGIGTPWEQDLANEFIGALHAILYRFGSTPGGDPENVAASQVADIVDYLMQASMRASLANPRTVNAIASSTSTGAVAWVQRAGTFGVFNKENPIEYVVSSQGWASPDALPALGAGLATAARVAVNNRTNKICLTRSSNSATTSGRISVGAPGAALTNVSGLGSGTALPYAFDTGVTSPEFVVVEGSNYRTLEGTVLSSSASLGISATIGANNGDGTIVLFEGGNGNGRCRVSGATWENINQAYSINAIVYSPRLRKFVIAGYDGVTGFFLRTSPDGLTWTTVTASLIAHPDFLTDEPTNVTHLTIVGGQMLVAATTGTAGSEEYANHRALWYSFDAIHWTLFDLRSGGTTVHSMAGGAGSLLTLHADGTVKMWGQL